MPKHVVLDFDGTLTDTEKEAEPFLEKWEELFSQSTGVQREELKAFAAEARARVLQDPSAGWVYNGLVIAPATADPYVLNTTVYQDINKQLVQSGRISAGPDLQALFAACYPHAGIAFKEGAAEFLDELLSAHSTVIVTNSDTRRVEEKLSKLGKSGIKVIGNAKKYVADNCSGDDGIPESIRMNGLPRPVYLRRMQYKAVLDKLSAEGFEPADTAVVGDIYELDLALPDFLGYRVVLLGNGSTPAHEKEYVSARPDGFLAESFLDVLCYAH